MAGKISRIFIFIVAVSTIISGFYMAAQGGDYQRGTFMVSSGFGLFLVAQVGAIYKIVRDNNDAS